MFQSFTGSAKRPRQVNLSGQNLDPFAASSWSPSTAGTQKTVANAQQERAQRQRERDRLSAARKIQRIWRGYLSRKSTAAELRKRWDHLESGVQQPVDLSEELRLLLAFYSPTEDIERLHRFAGKFNESNGHSSSLENQLPKLTDILLDALVT